MLYKGQIVGKENADFVLKMSEELKQYRLADPNFADKESIESDAEKLEQISRFTVRYFDMLTGIVQKDTHLFLIGLGFGTGDTEVEKAKSVVLQLITGFLLEDSVRQSLIDSLSKDNESIKKGIIVGNVEQATVQLKSKGVAVREGVESLETLLKQLTKESRDKEALIRAVDKLYDAVKKFADLFNLPPKGNLVNSKVSFLYQLVNVFSNIGLSEDTTISSDPLSDGKIILQLKEESPEVQVDLSSLTEMLSTIMKLIEEGFHDMKDPSDVLNVIGEIKKGIDNLSEICSAPSTGVDAEENEALKEHNYVLRQQVVGNERRWLSTQKKLRRYQVMYDEEKHSLDPIVVQELMEKTKKSKLEGNVPDVLFGEVLTQLYISTQLPPDNFKVLLNNYLKYPTLFLQKLYEILRFDMGVFKKAISALNSVNYLPTENTVVVDHYLLNNINEPIEGDVMKAERYASIQTTILTNPDKMTYIDVAPNVSLLDNESKLKVLDMHMLPIGTGGSFEELKVLINKLEGRNLINSKFKKAVAEYARTPQQFVYVISHLWLYMNNSFLQKDNEKLIVSDELDLCKFLSSISNVENVNTIFEMVTKEVDMDKSDWIDCYADFGDGYINKVWEGGSTVRLSIPIVYSAKGSDATVNDLTSRFPVYSISLAETRNGVATAFETSIVEIEGERREGVTVEAGGYNIDMVYSEGAIGLGFAQVNNSRTFSQNGGI